MGTDMGGRGNGLLLDLVNNACEDTGDLAGLVRIVVAVIVSNAACVHSRTGGILAVDIVSGSGKGILVDSIVNRIRVYPLPVRIPVGAKILPILLIINKDVKITVTRVIGIPVRGKIISKGIRSVGQISLGVHRQSGQIHIIFIRLAFQLNTNGIDTAAVIAVRLVAIIVFRNDTLIIGSGQRSQESVAGIGSATGALLRCLGRIVPILNTGREGRCAVRQQNDKGHTGNRSTVGISNRGIPDSSQLLSAQGNTGMDIGAAAAAVTGAIDFSVGGTASDQIIT